VWLSAIIMVKNKNCIKMVMGKVYIHFLFFYKIIKIKKNKFKRKCDLKNLLKIIINKKTVKRLK